MRIICFDTEVFKYDWLFCAVDLTNGKEFCFWNDREAFADFYTEYRNDLWLGYNVKGYDQFIVKGILCGLNPYKISQHIIKDDQPGWSFSNAFRKVPLNFYDVMSNRNMGSLKTLEGFMGMDIEETQVDFNIDRPLTDEERELTIKYCKHDVASTCEVLNKTMNMFSAHISIINTFQRPLRDMCKTQAQLAAKVLEAVPTEFNDYYDIRMPDTLDITNYPDVINWFLNSYNDTVNDMLERGENPDNSDLFVKRFYGRNLEIDIAGVPHVFGWGGVHGAIPKYVHTCSDDEVLLMADVNQLYPSLMVEYNILSRAVKRPERFRTILDTSLKLKAEGKKKEREPYKLINNISYGASGDKYNPMYDPLHRNLVCVFGQVLLLDLIEKIEPVCQLIQSNTDGILVKMKRKDVDTFKRIVEAWEERTRLKMTYDEFERIYQGDVNNYVAVPFGDLYDEKGKPRWKSKGAYAKELTPLDYDLPIVNKAVKDYLLKGIHPRKTIMNCDSLMEFQKIYKVSSKYEYAVWRGKRLDGKVFRVFASTDPHDTIIGKTKGDGLTIEKFALSPDHCFIWNRSVLGVETPKNLDKEYYVQLAVSRIKDKFGIEVGE